ncbi:hypothetical protein CXB51_019726 [Gossypium anomalum]|uniref:Uncharacterized protein n=1 Tax=Gossypium anomalum TaxID=47600 RepID=A0A8J5Z046_9ROSI|nr:hypothetical protein CXB51_019726 [Gossypium anomalum]
MASPFQVSLLTDNIQLITDALQSLTVVEVQGDQVRKRIDWMRWIMPPSVHFPTMPGQDTLAARSGASNPEDSDAGRPSYGDFSNQLSYSTMRDQPSVLMVGQQVIETKQNLLTYVFLAKNSWKIKSRE